MYDDGMTSGDEVAGDNIFTCEWVAPLIRGDWNEVNIEVSVRDEVWNEIRTDNIGSIVVICPSSDTPDQPVHLVRETRLVGNRPNPFRQNTTVSYDIANSGPLSLTVHDVTGRLIRTIASGSQAAGSHTATWDGLDTRGRPVGAGVYYLKLETARIKESRTLILLR
jgi:hypothetical protein